MEHGSGTPVGYGTDDVVGREWGILFPGAERAADVPRQYLRGASDGGFVTLPATLARSDGKTVDSEISIAILRPDGASRGFLIIARER